MEAQLGTCIECEKSTLVNDRRICRPCWYHGIKALDWLAAVRRYGLDTANAMFKGQA